MRVYLDYQIWDYIDKNDCIRSYFQLKKKKDGNILSVLLIWKKFTGLEKMKQLRKRDLRILSK